MNADYVRLTKDERDRAVVSWQVGRQVFIKRYADLDTARAIVERLLDNGSPRRGWAALEDEHPKGGQR